jgi:hypothetical protein
VDRAVDRTVLGVNVVRTFCRGVLIGLQPQVVGHVHAAHDQDGAVPLDLARGFRREEALAGWDLARFQRTTKGARQSASRGGNEIVERRIARLVDLRVARTVLGHRRVDAEMEVGVETDDLPSVLLAGTKSGGESMAPTRRLPYASFDAFRSLQFVGHQLTDVGAGASVVMAVVADAAEGSGGIPIFGGRAARASSCIVSSDLAV